MSAAVWPALGSAVNLRALGFILPLALAVLIGGWVLARRSKSGAAKHKPGRGMQYICPGRSSAACRDILSHRNIHDSFAYELAEGPGGALRITFTQHLETRQPLATVFDITFEGEAPTRMRADFVREAFGNPEPVMPEAMLDAFFAQKLDAERCGPGGPE